MIAFTMPISSSPSGFPCAAAVSVNLGDGYPI
ncbi:unannotated protein [freshwater metagenome]|uniref:Unannotated protein n=1 Tax=freshwater metagenome TaxID=449393 RepID=A0A6J7E5G6_9ZZZZ